MLPLLVKVTKRLSDLLSVLHGAIVAEVKLGYLAHAKPRLELASDVAGSRSESGQRGRAFLIGAEDTNVHARATEVRWYLDVGNAHKPNARVFDITADDVGELLTKELTDLPCPSGHGRPLVTSG